MCCEVMTICLKGLLAGVSIGLGGLLFTLTKWGTYELNSYFTTDDWTQPGQIVGSCVFSVGLMTVCWFKLMLFTGKVGLMFESRQETFYYVSLLIMLITNICGAVCMGLLSAWIFSRFKTYKEVVLLIANSKAKYDDSNDYLKCCMNALCCGVCVHLGVRGFANCETSYERFVVLLWFVLIFVYNGFEHCIANSFYFACAHAINREVFLNVALAICGNWLGTLPTCIITSKLTAASTNTTNNTDNTDSAADRANDAYSDSSEESYIESYNRRPRAIL